MYIFTSIFQPSHPKGAPTLRKPDPRSMRDCLVFVLAVVRVCAVIRSSRVVAGENGLYSAVESRWFAEDKRPRPLCQLSSAYRALGCVSVSAVVRCVQ